MRYARVAIVVIGVVVASARARAEESSDPAWPRWELGYGAPLWGISDGHRWAYGAVASLGVNAGIGLGRLVVIGEAEATFLISGAGLGSMERVGVDVRMQWWRWLGAWSKTKRHESRGTADSFVEIGAGKQWIDLPGSHVERGDLEIGVGIEGGMWMTKRDAAGRRRGTHLNLFARVRVLVAPVAGGGAVARCAALDGCGVAPSGYDLGIGVDLGGAWGR